MKKVYIFLAEGFEEVEAVAQIDVLRRAGADIKSVSLNDNEFVKGAHEIIIKADKLFKDIDENVDLVILPGGLPGAEHLAKSEKLQSYLALLDKKDKKIAAICAAPWALQTAGVLKDNYTCYPGFENTIRKEGYTNKQNVVIDKNIITSRGPATAMEFSIKLVEILFGVEKSNEVKNALLA